MTENIEKRNSDNKNYAKTSYEVLLPLIMKYIRKSNGVNISDVRKEFGIEWRTARKYIFLLYELGLITRGENRCWIPAKTYHTSESIEVLDYEL